MRHFVEEAKRIIRLNSISHNGNEELANYFASLMQDSGLKVNLQHVMHSLQDLSKRQFNIIGTLGDPLVDRKIRKGLLLLTHLDTVGPGIIEFWTENENNPFNLRQKDDYFYGLGTADAKLDFLCKLYAIQRVRDKKLKVPVYLVGTCGEEAGMFGCRYLIQSYAVNPKYILVGVPTDLKLVTSHKASCVYRVTIGYQIIEKDSKGFNRRVSLYSFGKTAHAAHPELGINALIQAMEFVQKTVDAGFDVQFSRVSGGEFPNQVPDRAKAEFFLTSHQFEDFKRFFRESLKSENLEKAFKVELGGLGESGISFLPPPILPCLMDTINFFPSVLHGNQKSWNDQFDPPSGTINLGRITQDTKSIEILFDLRLLPDLSIEELDDVIKKGIKDLVLKYPSLNIHVSRDKFNPPLNHLEDDEFVKLSKEIMQEIGIHPEIEKLSICSEAGLFQQHGFKALAFGPGKGKGNIHSANEHNIMQQLQQAVSFYERMIEKVCL